MSADCAQLTMPNSRMRPSRHATTLILWDRASHFRNRRVRGVQLGLRPIKAQFGEYFGVVLAQARRGPVQAAGSLRECHGDGGRHRRSFAWMIVMEEESRFPQV